MNMAGLSSCFHASLATRLLLLLSTFSSQHAVAFARPNKPHSHTLTANATHYDYIIVGGGLTGLVVANRLTEDPSSKDIPCFHGRRNNAK